MDEAEQLFAEAECRAGADERLRARVEIARGYVRQVSTPDGVHRFPKIAESAIAVLERHEDHEGLASAWKALARAHSAVGRSADAEDACRRSLEHCRLGGLPPNGYVLYLRGVELLNGPSPLALAVAYAEERLEAGDAPPSGPMLVLAECTAMTGEVARARRLAADVRALFDEGGRVPPAIEAEVELVAGDFAAAERIARPIYEHQVELGDLGHGSGTGAIVARALLELGRAMEAATLADQILETAPGDLHVQIVGRAISGRARGDLARVREALQLAEATQWLNVRARVRLDVAALAPVEEARSLVAAALDLFVQKGNLTEAARAR